MIKSSTLFLFKGMKAQILKKSLVEKKKKFKVFKENKKNKKLG